MTPKYLIFDFDGVLADTWEAAIIAHIEQGNYPDREGAEAEMHRYFSRRPNHTRSHELSDEELKNMYAWASEFGAYIHAHGFPMFGEMVHEVEQIDTPYKAVVSSGSQNYVLPAMAETKINPTHILAFENHHSKEEKIELVARDWGADIKDIYYFTDSLADVYELQNMIQKDKLIGVSWGFSGRENLLRELKPEYILDNASDINRLFDEND